MGPFLFRKSFLTQQLLPRFFARSYFLFCILAEMEFNTFMKAICLLVIVAIISVDRRADAEPLPSKERRALPPCYLQCPHEECKEQCLVDNGTWISLDVDCFSRCNPDCMRDVCGADV